MGCQMVTFGLNRQAHSRARK